MSNKIYTPSQQPKPLATILLSCNKKTINNGTECLQFDGYAYSFYNLSMTFIDAFINADDNMHHLWPPVFVAGYRKFHGPIDESSAKRWHHLVYCSHYVAITI